MGSHHNPINTTTMTENEEEATGDYARVIFKYKGQEALDKARKRKSSGSGPPIDLSDVPPQPPIPPRIRGRIREGGSRYVGVYFNKAINKWYSRIILGGKIRRIGYYGNEEEAAGDYARAVFKYKGQEVDKARGQISSGLATDLSNVPPQLRKSSGSGPACDGKIHQ
eukprot:scaffold7346_cov154-Skeletonema_menzelii.AAC.4